MTGVTNSVRLKFRILNNETGGVILDREYWDTPAADPMQVGTDNPPGTYLGQTGYFLLCLFRDPQLVDPNVPPLTTAEVIYDNAEVFEYDVPDAEITRSVLLSWSANTEEEQIVLGADSLASNAVWTPWPEPIFKRFGGPCVAVPVTASQQFLKLLPGTQFVDDFSATWGPFTNRNPYRTYWQTPGEDLWVTNGVLRVYCQGPVGGGILIEAPGAPIVARDFAASLDIVDWATSGTNWSVIGIMGRASLTGPPGDPTEAVGYGGLLALNGGGMLGKVRMSIWIGSTPVYGPTFDYVTGTRYRLEFSVVGTQLRFRVLNASTLEVIDQMSMTDLSYQQGFVGLWVNTPPNVPESHEILLDNLVVSATKP